MHMADALLSPVVGGIGWAAAAGTIAYSAARLNKDADDKKIPLMGVLGAFIFAAQMINFAIPGTGSSGHLGGGMILSILLGPHAAFIVMASILTVQALFFGDGGLLALGWNMINLGFFTCYVAYPLIYRTIVRKHPGKGRLFAASLVSAVVGLQLGAFGVVLETIVSGRTELPFLGFAALMQPIHFAIGVVEGLITAAVVLFVKRVKPEIIVENAERPSNGSMKTVLIAFGIAAAVIGGFFSWFASAKPDGLEWALFRTSGKEEFVATDPIHTFLSTVQEKTAFLPDYGFKKSVQESEGEEPAGSWPAVEGGTTVSGLVGAGLTLAVAGGIVFVVKRSRKRKTKSVDEKH